MYICVDIETLSGAPEFCKECKEEVDAKRHPEDETMLVCPLCKTKGKRWDFSNPNWTNHLPFMISCGAIASIIPEAPGRPEESKVKFWKAQRQKAMTPTQIEWMINDLYKLHADGHALVTVNGTGFDWQVLDSYASHWDAAEGLSAKVQEMAVGSIDLAFYSLAEKGWMIGLDAMCRGQGVEGKLHEVTLTTGEVIKNMSGWQAPQMWLDGEDEAVLEYLAEDVLSLARLMNALKGRQHLRWYTQKDKLASMPYVESTVKQCMNMPYVRGWKPPNAPKKKDVAKWIDPKYFK
ncbi:MAG: hypothetical protein DRI46_08100 [Chloroflexi bacterium]|nr:MAG: hypothetical protein DRI46_08100 [Chloroflexota bacterium]